MARVGSAYSDYRLNLTGFDQDVNHILQRMGQVQTQVAQLGQGGGGRSSGGSAGVQQQANAALALQRAQAGLEAQAGNTAQAQARLTNALAQQNTTTTATIGASRQLLTIQQQEAQAAQRASQSQLQLAQSQARLLASTGQLRQAEAVLTTELAKQAQVTPQVVNAQAQLARVQQQLAQGANNSTTSVSTLRNGLSGLTSAFGALGVAVGVGALINFGREAIRAANALELTQSTVRALSGSQERYLEVLNLARQGQRQYGGSLSDTLDGLGSLVNLSNRSSVSLEQLNNVSRRLAIVDPLQGVKGASIALKEFLTGTDATAITSLVRRFELPKTALKELTDESLSAADKLQALDRILAEQGITMEVLTNRQNTTAVTYERLGSSIDNAKVAIGGWLAQGLEPAARGLDFVANKVYENISALNSYSTKLAEVSSKTVGLGGTFAEYSARVAGVNAQLPLFQAKITPLTQAQYDYAQSLIKTGTSAAEAEAKARTLYDVSTLLATQLNAVGGASTEVGTVLSSLGSQMLSISSFGPDASSSVLGLAGAFAAGEISAQQFKDALNTLEGGYSAQASAVSSLASLQAHLSEEHANGAVNAQAAAQATREAAEAEYLDTQAKQALALQADVLAQSAQNAANAFLAANPHISEAGIRAQIAAGLIPAMTGELAILTRQIREAQAALANASAGNPERGGDAINRFLVGQNKSANFVAEQEKAATEARNRQILAIGSQTDKLKVLNSEYQRAVRLYGAGSAQAIDAETKLRQAQERGAKGAGGGAAKLSAEGKVLNQLEDQNIKYMQRMEDAEQSHNQRLASIEKRYQEQRLRAERSFKQQQLDSRADFYESLADIEDQGLRKALSEGYERVAREAADIRAKYGADAAAEYQKEAEKAIQEQIKLQDRINKLRSAKDAEGGKKSREQREADAAEAEYLAGVLALKKQADEERLRQLAEDGSKIENERQTAIQDEAIQYADAQAQIAESSDRASDKVVLNAQRRRIAVDLENESLAKTQAFYDRIQGKATGTPTEGVPTAAQGASPVAPPTDPTASWAVRDQGVIDILGQTNGILTGGFANLDARLGTLIERVRGVENAVRSSQAAVI